MKRVRTAVLGSGFMGRVHIEAIRRLGYVDVVGLASKALDNARQLAIEFGIDRIESDYRKLLDDKSIDAVHICTRNGAHFEMAKDALAAGKHVLCEKPLAISVEEARALVELARKSGLRNAVNHNLRFYPLVQQMRRMLEDGELGDILSVQGSYLQDWLLYETDWNWRVLADQGGPSRCLADIGSHWCDMAEHVTGRRITAVCTDLQIFHETRKQPSGPIASFDNKLSQPSGYIEVPVDTEDYGTTMFHMGDGTRGNFTASQVAAGRKNRLYIEIHGTKASVGWSQETPNELWIGCRDDRNQLLVKDPSFMDAEARRYADLPGGHTEGYGSTHKQLFRRFYASIADPEAPADYPQFADGLRQLAILQAELESNRRRGWVDVPAYESLSIGR
jgi:predicted dehydrogenase